MLASNFSSAEDANRADSFCFSSSLNFVEMALELSGIFDVKDRFMVDADAFDDDDDASGFLLSKALLFSEEPYDAK